MEAKRIKTDKRVQILNFVLPNLTTQQIRLELHLQLQIYIQQTENRSNSATQRSSTQSKLEIKP